MAFKVGVGKSDFASLREAGNYYVDKTELIYELVNDSDNEVTLFTRPRRFGKTLMMSMMENYFSIRKDSKRIFENLAITKRKTFCKEWMNQYPVLFISFKDAESETYHVAYAKLMNIIADVCKGVSDIANQDIVDKDDLDIFARLKAQKGNESDVQNSLKTIMRMLYSIYGKQVILLIDEYDVPLARASEKDTAKNHYYSKMLDVIKGIMSTALKDNEFLKFAVVTGCLRIAKESIFTGTNNFASYSVLDERFSRCFGFSEQEVERMLESADRAEAANEIKEWYDGYVFGNSYVYCPWDVVNHVSTLRYKRTSKPKNYWKNTSHNGILLTFVKHTDFDVSDKFEALLNGDTVVRFFTDTISDDTVKELINTLWEKREERATEILSGLLWDTISYNDYNVLQSGPCEDYYHAFLAGVFVGRGYSVDSNKEKGLGRPDILLKDKKNRRAIIIEAKKSDKESDMDKDCKEAIKQIIKEKYAEGLKGYEEIICYGAAFFQKQVQLKLK